jgi:hypothetical protein
MKLRVATILVVGLLAACAAEKPSPVGTNCVQNGRQQVQCN